MNTKDAVLNESRETKIIEDLGAVPPHVDGTVLAQTLVVEPVHLCYLSALMVAPNKCDTVGIPNLFFKLPRREEPYLIFFVLKSKYQKKKDSNTERKKCTFRATKSRNVSTLLNPRSTKSPRNK